MKEASIIVAYDNNRGIGAAGELPWGRDMPADLRHFREITLGHTVIMGRTTFDSIGQALPGRENIVVTSRPLDAVDVVAAQSLADALKLAAHDAWIIGGAQLYAAALPLVKTIVATEVHAQFSGCDTYFPMLGDDWHETTRESHAADKKNLLDYDFVTYQRESTPQSAL